MQAFCKKSILSFHAGKTGVTADALWNRTERFLYSPSYPFLSFRWFTKCNSNITTVDKIITDFTWHWSIYGMLTSQIQSAITGKLFARLEYLALIRYSTWGSLKKYGRRGRQFLLQNPTGMLFYQHTWRLMRSRFTSDVRYVSVKWNFRLVKKVGNSIKISFQNFLKLEGISHHAFFTNGLPMNSEHPCQNQLEFLTKITQTYTLLVIKNPSFVTYDKTWSRKTLRIWWHQSSCAPTLHS